MKNSNIRRRDGSPAGAYEENLVAHLDSLINEIAASLEYEEPLPEHAGAGLSCYFAESSLGELVEAEVRFQRVDLWYQLESGAVAKYTCRADDHDWDNLHPSREHWIVSECEVEFRGDQDEVIYVEA